MTNLGNALSEIKVDSTSNKNKENKIRFIDCLRGLAILLVVILHCANEVLFRSQLPAASISFLHKIFDQGNKGVQLFFLISAFTLFYSHNKRKHDEGAKYNFFIRRFFRIAPMYYFGIVLYLLIGGMQGNKWSDYQPLSVYTILSNVFFVHGFNIHWFNSLVPGGWSIADEMMFYCLIPILVKVLRSVNAALLYTVFCLLLKIIFEIYFRAHMVIRTEDLWNDYLFWYLPSQLPVFGFGIAAYYLFKNEFNKIELFYWFIMLAALLITQKITGISFIYIYYCFAFVALFLFLKVYNNVIFVNPITQFFGKISFSLYILHFAIIYAIKNVFFQLMPVKNDLPYTFIQISVFYVVVLIIAGGCSYVTYRSIELQFQKLTESIIARTAKGKKKG